MKIRLAKPIDVDAIALLWLAFQREHNRKHQRMVRETRENAERMATHVADLVPLGQVLVLTEHREVLGFALIVANLPRIDTYYATAAISDLYLVPAARGKGWGRRLLEAAIETIREKGLHGATIGVHVGNHSARGLYREMGFRAQQEILILPFEGAPIKFGPESE
ncbi:MAG: GCN5-related N-acetyltransferase [Cyanobacteria bacterium RYN_339]|nr:GCN5-related N-acetyltransferase [Cyanobacteria bacterium RYN_339]